MTNQELFISCITQFSEDEISAALNAVTLTFEVKELTPKSDYLYCESHFVILYRHKCKKQRFHSKTDLEKEIVYCPVFSETVGRELIRSWDMKLPSKFLRMIEIAAMEMYCVTK